MSALTDIQKWPGGYCDICDSTLIDSIETANRRCSKCCLAVVLAAPLCAAGPWRTDVENAEMGVFYWCFYGDDDYEVCSINMAWQWRNGMNCYVPAPIAIATINPPEVTP